MVPLIGRGGAWKSPSTRHPYRERAAVGLYLCRHPRPRHRRLCGDARKKRRERSQVQFPPGTTPPGAGQFESMERAVQKMKVVIPVTLLIIFLLLYLNFRRLTET